MNLRFKLLSAAGIFAAVSGLAIAPAAAAGVEVVAFSGTATGVNVLPVGGSGGYAFSNGGLVNCTVVAEVGTEPDAEAAEACTVNAAGTYVNVVCGTGWTGGALPGGTGDTATLGGEPEGAGANTTIHYGIVFVASLGVIVGTATGEDGGTVAGVVQITPAAGDCTTAVTAFTATVVAAGVQVP